MIDIFNISRFAATKHLKGKLSKLRSEVLGSGPLEGSPEPETASMDSAYDMTGSGSEAGHGPSSLLYCNFL